MQQSALPFDSVPPGASEADPNSTGMPEALAAGESLDQLASDAAGQHASPSAGLIISQPTSQIIRPAAQHAHPHSSSVPAAPVEYVRHPRARRYLIRVRLDGGVRVTIPRRGSKREAAAFYAQQQSWVASQQQRVRQLRATIPEDLPADLQKRLRREARTVLPARLRELAAQVGVTVSRISIRNQRHRWGSCSASGAISLNWRLVTMPEWVRDYVIYHELMHTKRMDHSPAFWALVKQVCPNYEEARRWLRRHAHAPHAATC